MVISRKARRVIYATSLIVTLVLQYPLNLPVVSAVGEDIGATLLAWGIPALALWFATRKKDDTGIGPYVAPTVLWLIFFAAHVLQQARG